MIKDEIKFNVGNKEKTATLLEEFPPTDIMRKIRQSPLAALEIESRILSSITEYHR